MASRVEQFRESEEVEIVCQCTKEELRSIAESYDVSLRASLKGEMQRELVEAFFFFFTLEEKGVLKSIGNEEEGGNRSEEKDESKRWRREMEVT